MGSTKKPGELVLESNPFDVMMGRGKKSNDHPGNIRFRKLIAQMSDEYNRSHNGKRARMVDGIISQIHENEGRFLQSVTVTNAKGETSAAWEIVSKERALAKVKQALRDLSSTRRKKSSQKQEAGGRGKLLASPEPGLQLSQHQQSLASLQLGHQLQPNQPQHHGIEHQLVRHMHSDPSFLLNHRTLLQQNQAANMFLPASSASWPQLPTNGFNNVHTTSLPLPLSPPGNLYAIQLQQARQDFFREQQLQDILSRAQNINSNNVLQLPMPKQPTPPIDDSTTGTLQSALQLVATTAATSTLQQPNVVATASSSLLGPPQPKDDDDDDTDDGGDDDHAI